MCDIERPKYPKKGVQYTEVQNVCIYFTQLDVGCGFRSTQIWKSYVDTTAIVQCSWPQMLVECESIS